MCVHITNVPKRPNTFGRKQLKFFIEEREPTNTPGPKLPRCTENPESTLGGSHYNWKMRKRDKLF